MLPESKNYKLYLTIYLTQVDVLTTEFLPIYEVNLRSSFKDLTTYKINCKMVKNVNLLLIGFLPNLICLFLNVKRYITHRYCIIITHVNERCFFYKNER